MINAAPPTFAYARPNILAKVLAGGRHALIEASAGTGKTYTIENLVLEFIVTGQARLDEILIVTFTEKATQELLARVRRRMEEILQGTNNDKEAGEGQTKVDLTKEHVERLTRAVFGYDTAQIFTIHGFCNRALADHAFHNGQLFENAIVDKREIFERAFKRVLRRKFAKEPLAQAFLTRYLNEKSVADLSYLLFEAANKRHAEFHPSWTKEAMAAANGMLPVSGDLNPVLESLDAAGIPFPSALVQQFVPAVLAEVDALKRREGTLDYDDMLERLHARVTGPAGDDLLRHLRAQYRFALIDEFQDTDLIQWRIFQRIFAGPEATHRLFLIGDPKQAIYGFRGADVQAYLQARDEIRPEAVEVPLEKNFRSTGSLIDAYNHLFHTLTPPFFAGEITYEAPVGCGKPAFTLGCADGGAPVHLVDADGPAPVASVYARVIQRLLNDPAAALTLEGDGEPRQLDADGIFVLTRSGRDQIEVAKALRAAGVPYTFYKQEGLFRSAEAGDVVALLRAVAEPNRQRLRLRAWATPFFGVAWSDLRACRELPGSHRLVRLLERWHELARERKFGALFAAILDESRVIERLLLLNDGEREVANFLQLFETLTEWAAQDRSTLGDQVRKLVTLRDRKPSGDDEGGDILRVESDRPAVQIMTIHKSKGLEADVVFVYGGMRKPRFTSPVTVYHRPGDRRRMLCIDQPDEETAAVVAAESTAEDARLYYVALTRARARLYLPFCEAAGKIDGGYRCINDRLVAVRRARETRPELGRWFCDEPAHPPAETAPMATIDPAPYLIEPPDRGRELAALKTGDLAPLALESYSGLKRRIAHKHVTDAGDERYEDGGEEPADELHPADQLRPGRVTGVFLHEALELVDPAPLAAGEEKATWCARCEIEDLFDDLLERYEIPPRHRGHAEHLVYSAMTAPLSLGATTLAGICRSESLTRELEFLYPIPEAAAGAFDLGRYDGFTVKRGYVRGFIDLVFEAGGKVYFADWKSDTLDDYGPSALAAHVADAYVLQNRLYTLALVRMLRATRETYEERFGGLAYIFLRGLAEKADGRHAVYFARPSWDELQHYAGAVAQGRWSET